jgi:ATP-dependent Clp protease ATP-binding subunit ClpC
MKKIIKDIRNDNSIILFIDEMHSIMGAGAAEGAIDAANILKPFLARGELQCIGATTGREFKKYIEKDPALERRFQRIIVREPDVPQTIEIIKGLLHRYEIHHNVRYKPEAIEASVFLSKRYIHDRFLPDKAIDCIDEAGAKARILGEVLPEEIIDVDKEIEKCQAEKDLFVSRQEYEKAAIIRDHIRQKTAERDIITKEWKNHEGRFSITVDDEMVKSVIQSWTGINLTKSEHDDTRFIEIESFINKKIFGQSEAIKTIAKAMRRNRSGIRKGNRPVASFLFVGSTGVGKTELAKVISEFLFHNRDSVIRMDMS